jgi:hypothetical protein
LTTEGKIGKREREKEQLFSPLFGFGDRERAAGEGGKFRQNANEFAN